MGELVPGSNLAVFACWVPIVSIIGICFPRIFLGKDVAHKLKEQGNKGRWFSYIRMSAFAYLVLLLVVPLLWVLAGGPRP